MEQRAAERRDAEFLVRCVSLGRATDCRLLNISLDGCLLEPLEPVLAEGNSVRMRIPGLASIDGRIVWADTAHTGVAFAAALHPAVVEYIAGVLAPELAERLFPPLVSPA
jgi:hypothetical protein